ncbi:hypothetical protein QYB63_001081 [Clostridium perfringens]|nr:hypothetical protein [Clostridium perfringens]
MKRFLWFNLEKIKTDPDYFLINFLFLILVQCVFYFPTGRARSVSISSGILTSIFFVYILLCKKDFSYKDVWNCFWNW